MAKLRAHNLAISLDGYMAGPNQSLDNPLGVGGPRLHEWVFETHSGRQMLGKQGGTTGIDDEFMARGTVGIGATIMGRNMFGPIRGEWGNEQWTGWWGANPPYHHPVFVLSHYAHRSITMEGGTTFHFVDGGIEVALEQAFEAAGGDDVRVGGGAEMHLVIVPILLGDGERLFRHVVGVAEYEAVELVSSGSVMHVRLARTSN